MAMTHADLEAHIATHGRGVLRAAMQDQLDLRALREARRDDVVDAAGTRYSSVESNRTRPLTTILGEVQVRRKAYRKKGHANLYPTDAEWNLPREQYSHGLRKLAAIEATRGSYEETVAAIARATGQTLGKRQAEELVQRAAADFEAFYTATERPDVPPEAVLVLSVDGKGVIMRPEALPPATAKTAAKSPPKLATRVSPGGEAGSQAHGGSRGGVRRAARHPHPERRPAVEGPQGAGFPRRRGGRGDGGREQMGHGQRGGQCGHGGGAGVQRSRAARSHACARVDRWSKPSRRCPARARSHACARVDRFSNLK